MYSGSRKNDIVASSNHGRPSRGHLSDLPRVSARYSGPSFSEPTDSTCSNEHSECERLERNPDRFFLFRARSFSPWESHARAAPRTVDGRGFIGSSTDVYSYTSSKDLVLRLLLFVRVRSCWCVVVQVLTSVFFGFPLSLRKRRLSLGRLVSLSFDVRFTTRGLLLFFATTTTKGRLRN